MLSQRCTVPPKMTTDHKGLMAGFDTITAFHAKLNSADEGSLPAVAGEVTSYFKGWVKDMEDHLAEEERDLVPMLKQHFTKADQDAFVQEILKSLGITGAAKELPWIVEGMVRWRGQKETDLWVSELPLPIQLFYEYSWKSTHDEEYTQRLNLMFTNAPPPAKEEICQIQ